MQFFLSHLAKLFSIVDGVFDLLDFVKDVFLAGLEGILLGLERLTYSVDLGQDVGPGLNYYDEGSPRLDLKGRMHSLRDVAGNVEGVEDAVAFSSPENHFAKLQHIFGLNHSRHVDETQLLERSL